MYLSQGNHAEDGTVFGGVQKQTVRDDLKQISGNKNYDYSFCVIYLLFIHTVQLFSFIQFQSQITRLSHRFTSNPSQALPQKPPLNPELQSLSTNDHKNKCKKHTLNTTRTTTPSPTPRRAPKRTKPPLSINKNTKVSSDKINPQNIRRLSRIWMNLFKDQKSIKSRASFLQRCSDGAYRKKLRDRSDFLRVLFDCVQFLIFYQNLATSSSQASQDFLVSHHSQQQIIFILFNSFPQRSLIMQHPQNLVLYEDAAVQITQLQITIKNYYSPLPIDKKIPFHQIRDVFLLSKSKFPSGISTYNPFTPQTQPIPVQKITYIQLWLKGSTSTPVFYPHDPPRVFNLIQTKIGHQELKENINLGMDVVVKSGKETSAGVLSKMGQIVQDTTNKISEKGHQWSEELKMKARQQSMH